MKTLLSIQEFGRTFGVSRSTVYRLKDKGEISFVRVGAAVRIPAEVADAWYASLSASSASTN